MRRNERVLGRREYCGGKGAVSVHSGILVKIACFVGYGIREE